MILYKCNKEKEILTMMNVYDYSQAVFDDVVEYLEDNVLDNPKSLDELNNLDTDQLDDELWIEDSVTGNGSGSYTMNALKAEQNLVGNYNLLCEALTEFGEENKTIVDFEPEEADITIRCYLLPQVIDEAIDYLKDEALENNN